MSTAAVGTAKVAVRRDPIAPAGTPARLFIVCPADDVEITVAGPGEASAPSVTCPNCGTIYTGRGWVIARTLHEPPAPVYRLTATPGFLDAGDPGPPVFGVAALLRQAAPGEPTWVIGDPKATKRSAEDGGRTLRVPARFKFYAIRDDHGPDCDCGCGGGSVVTFLLPEEY